MKKKDYYQAKRVSNFWNDNYIEYGSNGDKNKNLSLEEYLRSQNTLFLLKSKTTVFFFPLKQQRYEDFKFWIFFFVNINQFSKVSLYCITHSKKIIMQIS